MPKSAQDEMAKYGITFAFTDDGLIELTSQRGVKCTYSSRGFSPIIGFGVDGRIYIRLVDDGIAELRIDAGKFDFRDRDPSLLIAVPK